MNSPHLLRRLMADVPMLTESALVALIQDAQAAEHPGLKMMREKLKPRMEMRGDVAVVPVEGTLARKPDIMEMLFNGFEDSQDVLGMVEAAAAAPDAAGILLNVDSPGGFLTGGPEIADAVREANKVKPVVAYTGGTMASLAYWIGSQAEQVVASRSAQVGSIGAFTTHLDYTDMLRALGIKVEVFRNKDGAYKASGVLGTALNDVQRDQIQARIEASYDDFRNAVTEARGSVPPEAMRGQTFNGAQAKEHGLVDRIGSFPFAFAVLRSAIRARGNG